MIVTVASEWRYGSVPELKARDGRNDSLPLGYGKINKTLQICDHYEKNTNKKTITRIYPGYAYCILRNNHVLGWDNT